MKTFLKTTALALLILLAPVSVMAHGSIYTFKYIDGGNLITVTHNVHDAQAGVPITYHLRLQTLEGGAVPFEDVLAEVKRGNTSIKRQTMSDMPSDDTKFVFTYPKQGTYTLYFAFVDNGKQIAHSEFPIVVAAGLDNGFFSQAFILQTGAAFLAGIALTVLYIKVGPKNLGFLKRFKRIPKKTNKK